ncbi:MAG: undecaprenyl/decaprenyl-phosphate alpha-N-acetylglucosaminyl 1-phosphate transferase [Muribaculaceae bacterium]|nr:undecaprenyl/decaprenyl-phosphate alpha-N-acetylglucosaminyl 1-phosphate transferase [Muribaculaceae bacterium]
MATYWVESSLASFGVAVLIAGIIIPQIILIAFRKKLFDKQDSRKVHQGIVPRLGGIAFLPSILLSLALVAGINLQFGSGDAMYDALLPCIVPLLFEVCAVLMLYLVGIADDLVGVRYLAKFLVQIVSAVFLLLAGVYISDLYGLVWIHELPAWIGWIITALLVIYVVNSINLIDGIDGLAAGLSVMALMFYAVVLALEEDFIYCMIACAAIGTLVPFIYYNVFGNVQKQKKIFMGDTGSLTTGMILVFLCLIVLRNVPEGKYITGANPCILALSPLVVPCFDSVRVTLHRLKRHRNPFLPDRSHIHHKLLSMGLQSKVALAAILLLSVVFMAGNLLLSSTFSPTLILVIDILVWTLLNMWITHRIHKREKMLGRRLYD